MACQLPGSMLEWEMETFNPFLLVQEFLRSDFLLWTGLLYFYAHSGCRDYMRQGDLDQ